jgi:tetratricopeptide (TPR) repeat protein
MWCDCFFLFCFVFPAPPASCFSNFKPKKKKKKNMDRFADAVFNNDIPVAAIAQSARGRADLAHAVWCWTARGINDEAAGCLDAARECFELALRLLGNTDQDDSLPAGDTDDVAPVSVAVRRTMLRWNLVRVLAAQGEVDAALPILREHLMPGGPAAAPNADDTLLAAAAVHLAEPNTMRAQVLCDLAVALFARGDQALRGGIFFVFVFFLFFHIYI